MKQLLRWIVGARGNEAADDLADLFHRRAARIGRGRAVLRVAPDLTSLIAFGIGRRLRGGIDRIRRGALAGLPGDLRYATRVLRKTPVFSAIAVLILGLGIGATTAVFTVINAMLLVPTAADTSGTVGIYARRVTKPDEYRPFSYDDYRQIRAAGAPFTDVMAYTFVRPGVTAGGETRRTNAVIATANYFSVFDTRLALGRTFTANEERPGSDIRVVIVAYGYWQHAGGSPAILGSSVRLNGLEYTVVGVAPRGFAGALSVISPEFWLPTGVFEHLATEDGGNATSSLADPSVRRLMLVGRLQHGIRPAAAAPFLQTMTARLTADDPAAYGDRALVVQALSRVNISSRPASDGPLVVVSSLVLGMASLVLLLACLNLANMLFARATSRRREVAVRVAVGAGRVRIVRQLLLESLMLSILGGGLGLLLAILATQLLVRAASGILPFLLAFDGRPDWRVLAATALFSLLSTLVAGLAPAWRASRIDVLISLKDHEAGLMLAGRRFSIRNGLVVLQVAVCLALLVSAGLFVRGARVATNATPGFAPDRGILMQVDPTLAGYDASRSRATMKRVLDSLRSSSGIESASMASIVPFGEERNGSGVTRAGAGPETEPYGATYTVIGAHYFETLGIPILQGREFSPAEEFSTAGPAVAIIDEPLAALLFGQEPPFGQLIRIADDHPRTVQVIGIVAGVRNSIADSRSSAHLYVPFGQTSASPQYVHVRVRPGVDADTFQQSVRQMVLNQDPDLPILKIRTLGQFFRESLPLWVLTTAGRLFSTFGVVALILAVAGVYGMRAYVVSQRRREIAIRLALGADPRTVRWMMVSEGFAVAGVGLAIGIGFAWALSRVLRGMLVGVSSTDPIVFASACATLALAVLAASYAPARRVTNMAPTDALRSE